MSNSVVPSAKFFHRELSWLAFNRRVLEEALDERVPLAERAKFLAIVSSNLDEFVMVRLARLISNQHEPGRDDAGYSSTEQLTLVRQHLAEQVRDQYQGYVALVERFAQYGAVIVRREQWTESERLSLQAYFRESLEPILTPVAVATGQPLPLVANLKLHLALEVQPSGAPENEDEASVRHALIPIPTTERRLVALGEGRYALLEDVFFHCAQEMLPGYEVLAQATFRVTRDGEIDIDEDNSTDLLSEIEEELWQRGRGAPVRLEINDDAPPALLDWLRAELKIDSADVVRIGGPLDLTFLFGVAGLSSALQARQFKGHRPVESNVDFEDPFDTIRQGPVLLHHPYEAFAPVVRLLECAAADPTVLAIKQTLYRVSGDSPIVQALIAAASAGKQVTVLCELKARFDERRNIEWARRLEQAGAHVLYGVLGYKVHAKLLLIVRREVHGIRRYVHLGTGNYNDKTARIYEDFSYFTTDDDVCRDVSALFNMLTGFSRPPSFSRLLVAPISFRSQIEEWIAREVAHAKRGRPARIFGKMNSLVDPRMCEELYRASQAGVKIDLVIRGVCILRPGVPDLSENITVRSVVGHFLEHSRLYAFDNDGHPTYVIGSGDWMTRNLDRRVESLVRVTEPRFQQRLQRLIGIYLNDERSTRLLRPDGSYVHLGPETTALGIQELLTQEAEEAEARTSTASDAGLTPARKPGGSSGDVYG